MIGYYVHHHGRGHLTRAISVCAHLRSPVTLLSSIDVPDQLHLGAVLLPRDDDGPTASHATANGALHWAPLHDDGLRTRMRMIAEWVTATQPSVVVVDVSVEVAMMVRLLGVPVIVVALPGDRTDPPHDLVHRVADHILAAWPRDLYEPTWLRQHSAKTTYVGGISRFDGRARTPPRSDGGVDIVILDGAGGSTFDMAAVIDCATAHPQYQWKTLGVAGGPWVEDPWPALCDADLVVSSAGQSSVADIAAARPPAILVSAARPYAEQHATSRAIDRAGLALVCDHWPALDDWPLLIERARCGDPHRWTRWETDGAAARAASTIERVAAEHRLVGNTVRTVVVTAVRGRTSHLRNQLDGLVLSTVRADRHMVVAIDDDEVGRAVPPDDGHTKIIPLHAAGDRLPMAEARNLGARAAVDDGAELLIFLDVDCIPAPDLIDGYQRAAQHPDHRGALLCGPVTYLPAPGQGGYDLARLHERVDPHPARPAPAVGEVLVGTDYELFWSLSFAVTTPVWHGIGGFCTQYTGYGGEDTDFAQKAAAAGVTMRWIGAAHAFHQHHPVSDPPIEHVSDIVANAAIFHRRWGWWPMRGWLDAFEARGLIRYDPRGRPTVLAR